MQRFSWRAVRVTLKLRVRRPQATLSAEAVLSPRQLQDLGNLVAQMKQAAPDLDLNLRVIITAEGEAPASEVLTKLNALLSEVKEGWQLG